MKKKKIIVAVLIVIAIIAGISHFVFGGDGRTKLEISDDKTTQALSFWQMYGTYNNVYCIEHGQNMNSYRTYNIKTKVVLNGDTAQFYRRNDGGEYTLVKTVNNSVNNVLGAILTGGDTDGKKGSSGAEYTYGYKVNNAFTDAQLALYRYIGTWVETVGAKEYSFEYNGSGLNSNQISIAEKMIAQAETKAKEYTYNVTIYLLKYYDYSYQTLLVTDPKEPTQEKLKIPVKKEWLDNDNAYDTRAEITVKLFANDVDTGKIIKLNSSNNWEGIFEDLETKDENNNLIQYTIKETSNIPGYETSNTEYDKVKGFVITNRLKTEITVKKVWNDKDNLDEMRKTSLTVTLYSNGSTTNKTVTLNEENSWTAKFTDLYKCDINGNPIEYTVIEEIVEGYTDEVIKTEDEKGNATYIITNTHTPKYDGYIEISGKVWLDKPDGKGNDINGVLDNKETGLGGIKVTLKDANGNQFDVTSTTTTAEDGTYVIKVNYDNNKNVYKLYENSETVKEKLKTAYIEFEYDGMKYTTVATSATGENTSKAIENEAMRNSFDNNHLKVTTKTEPDSWTDKTITAITKDVISFENYADKTKITREEILKYCNGNGTYIRTNPNGAWNNIITQNHTCPNCSGTGHTMRTYNIEVEKIQNVNLGLFEREQPDVAIFSDLTKVEVTMNSQKYTYIYGVRGAENNNVGLQTKFQNKNTYTYRRPVNPADIAYIQEETNQNKMSVLVTYEVKVANLSTTLTTTIHGITNYFDKQYTLNTSGWMVDEDSTEFKTATNGELNITLKPQEESSAIELTYTVSLEAIRGLLKENATLNNAVEIESYSTVYGEKTLYAEQRTGGRTNKPYAGYDYNSHPGNANIQLKTGEDGVKRLYSTDTNGNIIPTDKMEDDTDIAPSFVLCKDDTPKVLSGTVWEDEDKDNGSGSDNFRLGDGKKSDKENVVANAKVELYKVNEDGTLKLANLYKIDGTTDTIPAVTISNGDGYYSFGNSENGYGVVTDRYVIKFIYGEGIPESASSTINNVNINARNYKSTIISSDTELYNLYKGTSTSEEWHLNIGKGYSIAVDDIEKRVEIEDLQYSNFNNAIYMTANSKTFEMQVEFEPNAEKTSSVKEDGKTLKNSNEKLKNELNIFDFGIIERAREDIYVTKTVDYLKVTLANGQTLIEGNPTEQDLSYVKAIGYKQNINSSKEARKALEKQMLIEIDPELIQGAQFEVRYAINVVNDSEKEYDYYVDEQIKTEYYYFGTNDSDKSPIITSSVNCLVDYVDADFVYTWENSEKWSQATIEELATEGNELINKTTLEAIKNGKYIAYTTSQFSELAPGEKSQTEHATAKKLLTSKEENVYENHLEILKIDAKTARTIKGKDKKGNIIVKEYKPGNYVPSTVARYTDDNIESDVAGRHEQDDDITKIVITPPTGLTSNITTYIIAAGAQLLIVLIGIVYIKKKRLIK